MKGMKAEAAALIVSVAVGLTLSAETVHTLYIDVANNDGPASWNNVAFNVQGTTRLLKDSLSNSTPIRATVTTRLNGLNSNASATPTGDASEFAPAGANNVYGHTNTWNGTPPILLGEMAFSNMNPNVAYTFTFYASRMNNPPLTDIRESRFTVTGANSGYADLDAANNSSNVVTVTGIYPDAAGVVVLRVEQGPNNANTSYNFFYFTAMKIVYEDPPPTLVYIDARSEGGAVPAGWNMLDTSGYNAAVLSNSLGGATGIRGLVTTPASAGAWGAYTPTGDAAEFAPAGSGAVFTSGDTPAAITFYDLKPEIGYTFTFYANRPGVADDRTTRYIVSGTNVGTNELNAASNISNVTIVANIVPAADRTIKVVFRKGTGNTANYNYLTAYKISYVDNGLPPAARPDMAGKRLLFFGNQYLSTENVPEMVADLAVASGNPLPFVFSDLGTDRTLASHIARVDGYSDYNVNHPTLYETNTWDFVVMQGHGDESSSLGDADAFRTNALALYRRVKNHASGKGADAKAVLLQTWARGVGASIYPGTFADPAAMQAEIDGNTAFATNAIAEAEGEDSVRLASAGAGFAAGAFNPDLLYASNLSTPASAGPELVALSLHKAIYGGLATDISYDSANAAGLTAISEHDWLRITRWADGLAFTEPQPPAAGDRRVYLLDACSNPAGSPVYMGWNYKTFNATGVVENLVLTNGYPTAVSVEVLERMNGTATSESTFTGDAAIFAQALANNAFGNVNPWGTSTYSNDYCEARFSGLSTLSSYTFTIYASRASTSGRETLYIVEGANSGSATLEPGSNSSEVAVIAKIRPKPDGTVDLKITAGPNNTSNEKFYHINALMIEQSQGGLLISVY